MPPEKVKEWKGENKSRNRQEAGFCFLDSQESYDVYCL